MEKNTTLLVSLIAIVGVLSLVTLFIAGSNKVDETALANTVTAQVISKIPAPEPVPTAAEIAALIPQPEAPVIPEFKSDQKVDEVWKEIYADDIEELETEAYNVAVEELEKRDYKALEKYLKGSIENFDELVSVEIKDEDITVVNLGLDEDENKVATVEFELKAVYSLSEGEDDDFKKKVIGTATVTFDKGDYSDEDVEIVFA